MYLAQCLAPRFFLQLDQKLCLRRILDLANGGERVVRLRGVKPLRAYFVKVPQCED